MAYRLRCEPLEARELLSGTPIGDAPGPLTFQCGPILADLTGDGLDDLVTRDLQGRILLRRGLPNDRFGLPSLIGPSVEALALSDGRLFAWAEGGLVAFDRSADGSFVSSRIEADSGRLPAIATGPGWMAELDREAQMLTIYPDGDDPRSLSVGPDAAGVAMSPLGMLVATTTGEVWQIAVEDGELRRGPLLTARPASAAADLDADGRPDVVSLPEPGGPLWVQLASGRSYTLDAALDAGGGGMTLADLNADGSADLVVCDEAGGRVLVYLGLGGGAFGPEVNDGHGFKVAGPAFAAAGHVSGGPLLDLVIVSTGSDTITLLLSIQTDVGWTLIPGEEFKAGVRPTAAAVGDLNGDDRADLVVSSSGDDSLRLLTNLGEGRFDTDGATSLPTGRTPYRVALGDFDGDGKTDAVSLNAGSDDLTYYPDVGNAEQAVSLDAGGVEPAAAAVRDVNRDGTDDLLVSTYGDDRLSLLLGGPAGLDLARTRTPPAGTRESAGEASLWLMADEELWPVGGDPKPATPPETEMEWDFQPLYPGLVPVVPLWMGRSEPAAEGDVVAETRIGRPTEDAPGEMKPGGRAVRKAELPPAAADEETPLNRFLLGAEEMPAPELSMDGTTESPGTDEPLPAVLPEPAASAEEEEPAAPAAADEEMGWSWGAALVLGLWVPGRRRRRSRELTSGEK